MQNDPGIDPYAIPSDCWEHEPSVIPAVKWSAMFTFLVCTRCPYTREDYQLLHDVTVTITGMEVNDGWRMGP